MSEPQPSFQQTQNPYQPVPEKKGMPGWAIALIAVIGGSAVLCVVASIAIIGALTMVGSQVSSVFEEIESEVGEVSTTNSSLPVATDGASAIGAPAASGVMEFVIASAGPVIPSEEELPAGEGMTYYAVNVEARNTGDEAVYFSAFNTQMQDAEGNIYSLSLFGQSNEDTPSDSLFQNVPANESLTATFVYEVPASATELFWVSQESSEQPAVIKVK